MNGIHTSIWKMMYHQWFQYGSAYYIFPFTNGVMVLLESLVIPWVTTLIGKNRRKICFPMLEYVLRWILRRGILEDMLISLEN
jgi:hypothetical protein